MIKCLNLAIAVRSSFSARSFQSEKGRAKSVSLSPFLPFSLIDSDRNPVRLSLIWRSWLFFGWSRKSIAIAQIMPHARLNWRCQLGITTGRSSALRSDRSFVWPLAKMKDTDWHNQKKTSLNDVTRATFTDCFAILCAIRPAWRDRHSLGRSFRGWNWHDGVYFVRMHNYRHTTKRQSAEFDNYFVWCEEENSKFADTSFLTFRRLVDLWAWWAGSGAGSWLRSGCESGAWNGRGPWDTRLGPFPVVIWDFAYATWSCPTMSWFMEDQKPVPYRDMESGIYISFEKLLGKAFIDLFPNKFLAKEHIGRKHVVSSTADERDDFIFIDI